ncbi:MAG TPA: response regulator [Terriglobales bacterium]|nr:response regulator [Terriglobales bacterium]
MGANPTHPSGAAKVRTSHRVLLCIDDDETQVLMQRALLNSKGYDVVVATGGRDGLAAFSNFHVDLVVVDYRMPDIDGGTVARKLKEKAPHVPIVMFTGVDNISPEALVAVNSLVKKGESPTALSDEVQRLLSF